jgi:hypothetical protein
MKTIFRKLENVTEEEAELMARELDEMTQLANINVSININTKKESFDFDALHKKVEEHLKVNGDYMTRDQYLGNHAFVRWLKKDSETN